MATTTTAAAPSSFADQDGLPRGVSASTTGVFVLDVLALATMAACVPTLKLFVKKRRHWNLATFGAGFVLACAYHLCQMDPQMGLQGRLWGVKGTAWRKADILAAQFVMARSFGHLISSGCHAASGALTEAGFPAAVAAMAAAGTLSEQKNQRRRQAAAGGAGAAGTEAASTTTTDLSALAAAAARSVSLGACSRALLAVVVSALAAKALAHWLHVREHARLRREQQRGLRSFWSVDYGRRGGGGKEEEEDASRPLVVLPPAPLPASPRPFFPHAATPEDRRRLGRAGLSILLGLLFFPVPEVLPELYFLFHSLWHLAMARGIHSLYCLLEGEPEPEPVAAVARAAAAGAAEAEAALRGLFSLAASSYSAAAAAAARRPSSPLSAAARRRRAAAASRMHLQQQGAAGAAGGHRRVLSVVFEGEEEEEEDGTSPSSTSSLSSLDDGGDDGKETAAAAAAESRSSTFLALSTSKARARFSPRTAETSCGQKGREERHSSSPLVNDGAACFSPSSSASSYLGSLSSLFQAWASGGSPASLSGILHASSKRHLAAGKRRASGLLAAAASLLSSSSSEEEDESDGGDDGDENEERFLGGARRRVAMLRRRRRRRLASASAGTAAAAAAAAE